MAGGKDHEEAETSAIEVVPEPPANGQHIDLSSTSVPTPRGREEAQSMPEQQDDRQIITPLDHDPTQAKLNTVADVRHLTAVLASRATAPGSYRLSELILMPEWTVKIDDDKRIPCVTAAAEVLTGSYELVLRAMWTHIYDPNPSLRHVEVALSRRIKQWLSPSASATVTSLFRTAKETRERNSVLGRFLLPGHVQVPSQNNGNHGNDVALLSIFPYFSLAPPSNDSEAARNSRSNHPVRTLFQTRYRLTNPKKRDKNQAIQSLGVGDIRATVLSKLSHVRNAEVRKLKLYVPQLWSLLVSGRALITDTPASIKDFCGGELYIQNVHQPHIDIDRRIQFIVELGGRKTQEFSCPADDCQCYFALLAQAQRFVQAAGGTNSGYELQCQSEHGEDRVQLSRARWLAVSSGAVSAPWRTIWVTSGRHQKDTRVVDEALGLFPISKIHPFFTWSLSEQEPNERYSPQSARINVWLIYLASKLSVLGVQTHRIFNVEEGEATLFDHPSDISTAYFAHGQSAFGDGMTSRKIFAIFEQTQKLFGVYLPGSISSSDGGERTSIEKDIVVRFYWLLVSSLLQNIDHFDVKGQLVGLFSSLLNICIDQAINLHQGMFPLIATTDHEDAIRYVNGTRMITQIADSFFNVLCLLHDVDRICSSMRTKVPRASMRHQYATSLQESLSAHKLKILNTFEQAQQQLIENVLQRLLSSSFPELEPLVTPERILILLLTRLSRGVCGNSTFDIMELYTRIVEKLSSEVSNRASQFLLTEIDQVDEELDIILEILNQQHTYIKRFMDSLDPDKVPKPTTTRRANFIYEKASLNALIADTNERLRDCGELQSQVAKLGMRHARNSQVENGRKLMIFTVVTVTFLPLSFVSSFFGMNLKGIGDTNQEVDHFWAVAIPFTGGVLIVSLVLLYWRSLASTVSHMHHAIRHSSRSESEDGDEDEYMGKSASGGNRFGEA